MNIEFVEWGLANTYGDTIELHKDLQQFPNLYSFLLEHELKHKINETAIEQLNHDATDSFKLIQFSVLFFMLLRPKTWIQFLPFHYHSKYGFVYDISAIVFYTLFVLLCVGIWLFWISI